MGIKEEYQKELQEQLDELKDASGDGPGTSDRRFTLMVN